MLKFQYINIRYPLSMLPYEKGDQDMRQTTALSTLPGGDGAK